MTVIVNNLTDLTTRANSDEAWIELRRCFSEADYAAWAREWAEPALLAIDDLRAHAVDGDYL